MTLGVAEPVRERHEQVRSLREFGDIHVFEVVDAGS